MQVATRILFLYFNGAKSSKQNYKVKSIIYTVPLSSSHPCDEHSFDGPYMNASWKQTVLSDGSEAHNTRLKVYEQIRIRNRRAHFLWQFSNKGVNGYVLLRV